jgi:hypothetical protein
MFRKIYSLLLASVVGTVSAVAQCNQNVTLDSQAAVDNFPVSHGCSILNGSLGISGPDIINLDSLHMLSEIKGSLAIFTNPELVDISGLSSVHRVGQGSNWAFEGGLRITQNTKLADLTPLSSITYVDGAIIIEENNTLVSLDGLNNITGINTFLRVANNPALENIDGLANVTSIGVMLVAPVSIMIHGNSALTSVGLRGLRELPGGMGITSNASLADLRGLDSLQAVRFGSLTILENASLRSLDGLNALTDGPTNISIADNPLLENIDGFESMTYKMSGGPSAYFTIRNNPSLTNLDGLRNLNSFYSAESYLTITDNPSLTDGCGIYKALSNTMDEPNFQVEISNNGPGVTTEEILANCAENNEEECNQNVNLTTQAEVDAFPQMYGCRNITGYLRIEGNDIANLDGLHNIVSVANLRIASTSLLNLDGLVSLGRINGGAFCSTCSYEGIDLSGNNNLTSVSGLSSLTYVDGHLAITSNPMLTSLDGLENVDTVGRQIVLTDNPMLSDIEAVSSMKIGVNTTNGWGLTIRNTGITDMQAFRNLEVIPGQLDISDNKKLVTLSGLENLTSIGNETFSGTLAIIGNTRLDNVDGLSALASINGNLLVYNNPALKNIDGFQSLEAAGCPCTSFSNVSIVNNDSLINVNGLSSLTIIREDANPFQPRLNVRDNAILTEFCGLYNLLAEAEDRYVVGIGDNGAESSVEEIVANGPCPGEGNSQPTNMQFSMITDFSMRVTFTAADPAPAGYLMLLRAHGSPYPNHQPTDGVEYHVGNLIGNSTIIVGKGNKSVFNIVSLSPGITYYYVLYMYDASFNYSENPLMGSATTTNGAPAQPTDLVFSDITDNTMTVSFTPSPSSSVAGYVTVMRAGSPSYPNRTPLDGTQYQVGNLIGSTSIVVSSGTATTLYIVQLSPDTDYWFDIYSYSDDGTYDYLTVNPLEGMQRTLPMAMAAATSTPAAFPNPFTDAVTIRFSNKVNAQVRIMIYDKMGAFVAEVINDGFTAGEHDVTWNGEDHGGNRVPDGMYLFNVVKGDGAVPLRGVIVAGAR